MATKKNSRRTDGVSFRNFDGCWYSSVTGKYAPLRDESGNKIKGKENEPAAKLAFHRLACQTPTERQAVTVSSTTLAEVCERYLGFLQAKRSKSGYRRARIFLNDCVKFFGVDFQAANLKKRDVFNWIESHGEEWNNNTINRGIGCLCAALNRAVNHDEILTKNPIMGIERPATSAKVAIFKPEEEALILNKANSAFAQLFLFLIQTGARPFSEATKITAKHLRETAGGLQVVFKEHKTSRKTGTDRVIYLNAEAANTLRFLASKYPEGPLFRNLQGNPWNEENAQQQIITLRGKLNLPKNLSCYAARHTFATRKLAEGQSIAVVASLLGNTIAICQKHYGHLDLMGNVLWQAINGANGNQSKIA